MSCGAPTACVAAGSYTQSKPAKESGLFTERLAGGRWGAMTIPSYTNTQFQANPPDAISCPAADACMLIDDSGGGASWRPLAERWNGQDWQYTRVAIPKGATRAVLPSVSCTGRAVCVAVGYSTWPGGIRRLLAERWNGLHWTVEPVPSPKQLATSRQQLTSVSCIGTYSCMAVGEDLDKSATIVERYSASSR